MLLSYTEILIKYNFVPKGIIHLGAHKAEEAGIYYESGVKKVIWVEGNPELVSSLQDALKNYPGNKVYNIIVSDTDDQQVTLNVTNSTMSSSILGLSEHLHQYPDINVVRTITLKSKRLDNFIKENSILIDDYDYLNIDLQGAELLALKGLGEKVRAFKYIQTEVNLVEMYDGCPLLEDLDAYLGLYGFKRVETSITAALWGEAFYVQSNISSSELKKSISEAKKIRRKYIKENRIRKLKSQWRIRFGKIQFLRYLYHLLKRK